jgi:hypothetical protein
VLFVFSGIAGAGCGASGCAVSGDSVAGCSIARGRGSLSAWIV